METTVDTAAAPLSPGDAAPPQIVVEPAPPPTEIAKPTPVEPGVFAKRFQELSAREKTLVEQTKEWKENESQFKSWKDARADPKGNLGRILDELGVTPEDVYNHWIETPNTPDGKKLSAMEKEIAKLKAERENDTLQSTQAEYKRQVDSVHEGIRTVVDSDSEKYEFINANNGHEAVYEAIFSYWQETGKYLTINEACDLVEAQFEKDFDTRFKGSKKIEKRFVPTKSIDPEPKAVTANPPASGHTTLSNQTTTPLTASAKDRPKSREESLARAAEILRWT